MKFDAPPPPADHRELAELSGLVAGRRLWVAASTHAGEERAAAEAHLKLRAAYPDLLTLIAPRHPERGEEIAEELAELGLACRLRSRGERPDRDCAIYICDTIGELGLFYRLAGVVFVGRSLFSGGGQNPIEPAKLASAILHGPHVGNFADVYAPLDVEGGAMTARDADELAARARRAVRGRPSSEGDGAGGGRGRRAARRRGRAGAGRALGATGGARAMRAPRGWRQARPGLLARALSPLGAIYGAATARRMARPGVRVEAPVLCVGNFVVGGAGKTPTALALARLLRAAGERPAFLSRGYGGEAHADSLRVSLNADNARRVGDEPLLLARVAPCYVGPDRVASARLAIEDGASVLIMDDGLQNPALEKTLSLAVVDGEAPFGNGLCLPAGPLRAPIAAQMRHVDALVMIGGDAAAAARAARRAASRFFWPVSRPTRSRPRSSSAGRCWLSPASPIRRSSSRRLPASARRSWRRRRFRTIGGSGRARWNGWPRARRGAG